MAHRDEQASVSDSARVTNDRERIDRLWLSIELAMQENGYPKSATFAVRLALEEAMTNAFRHGLRDLPDDTPITVDYGVDTKCVRIAVEDPGPGFDPADVPDPTAEENLTRPGGRGLLLIRSYMSHANFKNHGRRLEMVYERPAETEN
ncbi:MAG: ATP-binding protein [Phycisphaerales bacterium]|jgi:serine/threonine-protein kinase RsbW